LFVCEASSKKFYGWSQRQLPRTNSPYEGKRVSFKASYYLKCIANSSGVNPCCFVVAVMYLKRFNMSNPRVMLTSRTVQRLLLVAVMTAAKYLEDIYYLNTRWCV
jgi:hypothetical protein